jgi:hypothetical protein
MRARTKLFFQVILAIAAAYALRFLLDVPQLYWFAWEEPIDIGIVYIPIAVFIIVGMSNAINFTDGLDGLAGLISATAFAAYGGIALLQGQIFLARFCFTIVGALFGFLWFNVHPANLIMGDTGALSLGATLGVVALMTGQWLLLPIIAIIPVSEALSVILQVGYFKMTKRQAPVKMAPFHHHFELIGWSETQVVQRFWLVGLLFCNAWYCFGFGIKMMKRNWAGVKVLIIGAARQGLALARFLAARGAVVTLNDQHTSDQLQAEVQSLAGLPIEWALGGHPLELLDQAELVCVSGGVPLTLPILTEARLRGLPLSNDSQIFIEAVPAPVIGITGSAGKTTTTTLVGRAAEAAAAAAAGGKKTWVGGNIGLPLVEYVEQIQSEDLVVVELSSFQLELMDVSPQVAAVLNITPNHLDRHETLEAYYRRQGAYSRLPVRQRYRSTEPGRSRSVGVERPGPREVGDVWHPAPTSRASGYVCR